MAVVKLAQEPCKEGNPQSYSISELTAARRVGLRRYPTLCSQRTSVEVRTSSRGMTYINLGLIAKHGADQNDVIFGGHDDSWRVVAVNTSCLDHVDGMLGTGRTIIESGGQEPRVKTMYSLDSSSDDPNELCVDIESEAAVGQRGLGMSTST